MDPSDLNSVDRLFCNRNRVDLPSASDLTGPSVSLQLVGMLPSAYSEQGMLSSSLPQLKVGKTCLRQKPARVIDILGEVRPSANVVMLTYVLR